MNTETEKKASVWSTGLAMFAMFFGAGNIVFPLVVGQFTQDKNLYGSLGMTITAVLVPLLGLLAMMLFEGDYLSFFRRIGKIPGFILTLLILCLIGPFGGIPRCITISYSTLSAFGLNTVPYLTLFTFSLFSCALIFLFTIRRTKLLSLLGFVLTPLLLFSLGLIMVKGFFSAPEAQASLHSRWTMFSHGFLEGYNTMDLLASFFFSSVVLICLRQGGVKVSFKDNPRILKMALWASLVAAILLGIVYFSFSFLAAHHSAALTHVAPHQMLGTLAYLHLGPSAGLIAGSAVAFACLTTEIALTAISAEFLKTTLLKNKISYPVALLTILGFSFAFSTLQFEGITTFLVPILQVCYPALIVLSLLNIAHKMFNFKPIKLFFYSTFLTSLICYFSFGG